MKRTLATTLLALVLLASAAPPANASLFGKSPEDAAREAVSAHLGAVTIWVDASWGFRKKGAANSLSSAHQAFVSRGYKVVDVSPYIENGDLQGFFVTYQTP